ncbi:NUDIX hydrolase [Phreatobacter sp. HK31-P]|nr:NUDIX hydrolase [Phreatobacter sp.]
MTISPPSPQFAALPYRLRPDGTVEIMLITSRTTRRWIIPKGWPMGQRAPHKVAELEAMEEAGVAGRIGKRPLGVYHYDKLLSDGSAARCRVDVYALEVRKEKASWPEKKRRERRWVDVEEAASLADDAELVPLIRGLGVGTP